jgi:hypothetical protein
MLPRHYRTVAADCGVDEMLAHFLMGHARAGILQRCVVRMILSSGPAMREAQRKISKRIVSLLGIVPQYNGPVHPNNRTPRPVGVASRMGDRSGLVTARNA